MKAINQYPFLIGLEKLNFGSPRLGCPANLLLELTEGHGSINFRLSKA
jgi:hypothetical protein